MFPFPFSFFPVSYTRPLGVQTVRSLVIIVVAENKGEKQSISTMFGLAAANVEAQNPVTSGAVASLEKGKKMDRRVSQVVVQWDVYRNVRRHCRRDPYLSVFNV